jgi:hypothetical protein
LFFSFVESGKKESGKCSNDRNYNQQLYESEAAQAFIPARAQASS